MDPIEKILDRCRVKPLARVRLADFDPGWAGDKSRPKAERKQFAQQVLSEDVTELAAAQELLYASDTWSVLVVLQALDAAGKDGTIKHVMSGLNPQGCQVFAFKHPSTEELDHNFLWRCMKSLPERGRIGIFNRSYYEEVLVVKVHPQLVAAQRIPGATPSEKFWQARYDDINHFERHLVRNGTAIVKLFLNVSREEQRQRLLERLDKPEKHWKFSAADLAERDYWDEYQQAYEECLSQTSSEWAPWYVVPADHKWVTRAIVAAVMVRTIRGLNLQYPEVSGQTKTQIEEARRRLEAEVAGQE